MRIEVFEDYNEEGAGLGEPFKMIIRKPFPREIWKIQNLDVDNMETDESFNAVADLVTKVIIKAPEYFKKDNKVDVDIIPADIFFKIFRISASSTLKETKKLSEI